MYASRKLIWGVGAGLLLLAGLAFVIVWRLELTVMDEAIVSQARAAERNWQKVVDSYAHKAFRHDGGDLGSFGDRLVIAAEANPTVLDVAVVTPEKEVIRLYSRHGRKTLPCAAKLPTDLFTDHEHASGSIDASRMGCLSLPINVDGKHRGSVVVHTMRDWFDESQRAGQAVKRTAVRLAPVFLMFYILLAGMLVVAGRTARRWRARAASTERVEALGVIADGINHEIRNPLNAVSLSLQLLERKENDPETRGVIEEAHRQTRRIGETIEEFVRFTRVSHLETRNTDLTTIVAPFAGKSVKTRGTATANVDRRLLGHAIEAMLGLLEPPVSTLLEQTRTTWKLTVTGETVGLDAAGVESLFDPYVRRRPRDVGRGLALARAVFQAHGGDLRAQLKGSTLTLKGTASTAPPGERA